MTGRPSHALFWPLLRREIVTRFASGPLGFFWAFFTPLAWVGVGMAAYTLIGRLTPIETHPAIFLATGILPYVIFRQSTSGLSRALIANRILIGNYGVHRHVMALSYAAIEGLVALGVSALIILISHWSLGIYPRFEMLRVIFFLLAAWGLGAGLGLFLTAFIFKSDTVARIIPSLMRPMFWLSGVFFLAQDLTPWIRDLLAINPLFLIIEGLRSAYFETYQTPLRTVLPIILWISTLTVLGASLLRPQSQNTVLGYRI